MNAPVIDWPLLRAEAVAASRRAYVPYSRYPVGAAALTSAGRVVSGCNVENAAFGVVLCAECGLVSSLLNSAEGDGVGPVMDVTAPRERLVALSCVDGDGTPITPCGRCRQLLAEHAEPAGAHTPGLLIDLDGRDPLALTDLLPHAFGITNLDAVATSAAHLKGES